MSKPSNIGFTPAPPFKSSNLNGVLYDYENHKLRAEFKTGDIYDYYKVPEDVFIVICDTIETGDSVGKAFNALVKKGDFKFVHIYNPKVDEPQDNIHTVAGAPVGMLWYDNSAMSLENRIIRAVNYYMQKYETSYHQEHQVLINPENMPNENKEDGYFRLDVGNEKYGTFTPIAVYEDETIMPNYFLVSTSFVK